MLISSVLCCSGFNGCTSISNCACIFVRSLLSAFLRPLLSSLWTRFFFIVSLLPQFFKVAQYQSKNLQAVCPFFHNIGFQCGANQTSWTSTISYDIPFQNPCLCLVMFSFHGFLQNWIRQFLHMLQIIRSVMRIVVMPSSKEQWNHLFNYIHMQWPIAFQLSPNKQHVIPACYVPLLFKDQKKVERWKKTENKLGMVQAEKVGKISTWY